MRKLIGIAVAILVLSLSVAGCTDDTDESTPKSTGSAPAGAAQALDAYLSALQAGDSAKLLAMSNPRLDAKPAIKTMIDKVGNRTWTHVTIAWREVISASGQVADVTAIGPKGEPISDRVFVDLDDGRWEISLGEPLDRRGN